MDLVLLAAFVIGFILVAMIPILVIVAALKWHEHINVPTFIYFAAALYGLSASLFYVAVVLSGFGKIENTQLFQNGLGCVVMSIV